MIISMLSSGGNDAGWREQPQLPRIIDTGEAFPTLYLEVLPRLCHFLGSYEFLLPLGISL